MFIAEYMVIIFGSLLCCGVSCLHYEFEYPKTQHTPKPSTEKWKWLPLIFKIETNSVVYKSNKHQIYPRTSKPASEKWKWSPLILSSFSKSWTTVSRECSFTILADPNTSRLSLFSPLFSNT